MSTSSGERLAHTWTERNIANSWPRFVLRLVFSGSNVELSVSRLIFVGGRLVPDKPRCQCPATRAIMSRKKSCTDAARCFARGTLIASVPLGSARPANRKRRNRDERAANMPYFTASRQITSLSSLSSVDPLVGK